jgi:glycosyltransferase involved in cell wall biosynthesis
MAKALALIFGLLTFNFLSPTFSIIIPTYNRADHLPAAIDSVLRQSRSDWELIVVDDGSKDNTREVVSQYAHEPRVKYHHQENRELNGARNTGVRLARGTYCCFLDDDDSYDASHLEELTTAIASTGGEYGIYRTNMRIITKDSSTDSLPFTNHEDALTQLWQTPRNLLPLAIRRDLLAQQPFDENDLLIDDFIWLNTALTHTTLFQAEATTVNYIQHDTNRSKLYHSVHLLPTITARLEEAYRVPGVAERVDRALLTKRIQHQHMHLARELGRRGATITALKTWYKGLSYTIPGLAPNALKTLVRIFIR